MIKVSLHKNIDPSYSPQYYIHESPHYQIIKLFSKKYASFALIFTNMSKTKPIKSTKVADSPKVESVQPFEINNKLFKTIFWILVGLVFVVRPFLSTQFGPSSDEMYHKGIGDLAWEYYATFGKNDTVFDYKPNDRDDASLMMINYSPALEGISAGIYKNTGWDPFTVRHIVFSFFTFMLFLFVGLAAQRVAGWRAAVLALLFMLLSPRIFAESFNNAKDPTFAAAYMLFTFGAIWFLDELKKPSWKATLLLTFGLGFSLMIRSGGIMVYAYILLFVFLAIMTQQELREQFLKLNFAFYKDTIVKLVFALLVSWVIALILWPAALRDPIMFPINALKIQAQFPIIIRVLFGGAYVPSNEVPWSYNPTYIWLTSPIIVLAGVIAGFALIPKLLKNFDKKHLFVIGFITIFPIFFIIYKKSALYNGWRHSYFTYTGVVLFAAVAFEMIFRLLKNKTHHIVLYAVLAIGLLLPTIFIAENLSVSMNYFNELSGGFDKAYGNYQIDYYASSARPAAVWVAKNIPFKEGEKIVSNNPWELNVTWEQQKSKHRSEYIRFRERNENDWDYAVFLPQFVDPNMMRKGFFPPKGTIHTVKIDNSTLACVVKRENKSDFFGIEAVKKNDFATGIKLLEEAIKYDINNEIAWAYLGLAYANVGRTQDAITALTNSLNISPEYQLPAYYYQQISGRR